MSSTVVCHNFASETTTLKLKVPAEPRTGNWPGFLQTVYSGGREGCYGHPLSPYTAKSLELCTENLGSETGTDTVTDCSSIFSCSPPSREAPTASFWTGSSTTLPRNDSRQKARDFPPPLTTMTGSSSLQVSRRTEGGRLIIEAVETPFRNSYLQAERSDGRLRLSFFTPEATCSTADAEECGGEMAEDGSEFESEEEGNEFESEINLDLEIENFQQLSGCKQGSHGRDGLSCNWKPPVLVSIS